MFYARQQKEQNLTFHLSNYLFALFKKSRNIKNAKNDKKFRKENMAKTANEKWWRTVFSFFLGGGDFKIFFSEIKLNINKSKNFNEISRNKSLKFLSDLTHSCEEPQHQNFWKYQKENIYNEINSNKFPNAPACPFLPTTLPLTKTLINVFFFFLCCYLSCPRHIIEEQTIKKVSTFFSNNLKLNFHSSIVSTMGKKNLLNPLWDIL